MSITETRTNVSESTTIPSSTNKNTIDFTADIYTSSEGDCNKKKWSENCWVTWDGISYGYGNNNPCSKD